MTNITWAESEHEYPNGAVWPDGLPTYSTIQSARANSAYPFPEQAYLYCIGDGLVLGSCEVHVEKVEIYADEVEGPKTKYAVVTMHRIEAGRKYTVPSLVSQELYDTSLEYVILEHIRRANEYREGKTS